MSQSKPNHLVSVTEDGLPDYPISTADRLDSHYFIAWNVKRWRKSAFRQLAEPDVGWFGFLLFCEAQDEAPVGTLPTDERLLAQALNITVDRWRQLVSREITPLHNWSKVLCDNGEIRLAHPVVTEVAMEAMERREARALSNEEKAVYARMGRLRSALKDLGCSTTVCNDDRLVERMDQWMLENVKGQRRRPTYERALEHAAAQRWFDREVRR